MCWWGGGCGGRYWYYGPYEYYGDRRPAEERESAMEILRRRYAKGEITKEQFEKMKKDLYGSNSPVEEKETAMDILQRRYANGEITKDQFEQMKKDVS